MKLYWTPILVLLGSACLFVSPTAALAEAFDLYIDARQGDNANPGTRESPRQSLPEKIEEGTRIGLARGSVWRTTWKPKQRVVVGAYGEGPRPVITGYEPLDPSTAEPVDGYPGVFRFAVVGDGDKELMIPGIYVGDGSYRLEDTFLAIAAGAKRFEPMVTMAPTEADALALVAETPGRFYYAFRDGTHHYYINSGKDPRKDDRQYEFKKLGAAFVPAEGSDISSLRLLGTRGRNGVAPSNNKTKILWRDVDFQDGGLHTMLAGTGRAWIDTTSIANPNGPTSIYHLNGPLRGSPGAAYVRSKAIGPGMREGSFRTGGTAYYDHDSKNPNIVLLDVESQGARNFHDYSANSVVEGGALYIIGARVNDRAGLGQREGMPPALPFGSFSGGIGGGGVGAGRSVYIENVVAYLGELNGIMLGSVEDEYIIRNSVIVYRQHLRSGSLFAIGEKVKARFEHCTFIIDTYGDDLIHWTMMAGPLRWSSVSVYGGAEGQVHFEKCIFVVANPVENFHMHFPHSTETLQVTASGSLFSTGFSNLPRDGGNLTSPDIFAVPYGWRDGDFQLSPSSPALEMDAGYRADRAPVYRPKAETLVEQIVGFKP